MLIVLRRKAEDLEDNRIAIAVKAIKAVIPAEDGGCVIYTYSNGDTSGFGTVEKFDEVLAIIERAGNVSNRTAA